MNMLPDFSGTWRANLEASKLLGPTPLGLTVILDHRDPELKQTIVRTTASGDDKTVFAFWTDGQITTNLIGGADVGTWASWRGSELCVESRMKRGDRELQFRDYWSLSADGLTLTMEHRDDDLAGQVSILEKS